MPSPNLELVGYLAMTFGAAQLVPEVIKALRTHHLKDLSWGTIILMIIGLSCWIVYGLYKGLIPVACSAAINLVFATTLAFLKLHYTKHRRPAFEYKQNK